jgi:hypothetical protein
MELTQMNLKDAKEFAMMWNCTEIGERIRQTARLKKVDEMRHLKHSLEYGMKCETWMVINI